MTNSGDILVFEVIQKYPRKNSCLAIAIQSMGTGKGILMDCHYLLDRYDLESILYLNTDYIESILVDNTEFNCKRIHSTKEGFY